MLTPGDLSSFQSTIYFIPFTDSNHRTWPDHHPRPAQTHLACFLTRPHPPPTTLLASSFNYRAYPVSSDAASMAPISRQDLTLNSFLPLLTQPGSQSCAVYKLPSSVCQPTGSCRCASHLRTSHTFLLITEPFRFASPLSQADTRS